MKPLASSATFLRTGSMRCGAGTAGSSTRRHYGLAVAVDRVARTVHALGERDDLVSGPVQSRRRLDVDAEAARRVVTQDQRAVLVVDLARLTIDGDVLAGAKAVLVD